MKIILIIIFYDLNYMLNKLNLKTGLKKIILFFALLFQTSKLPVQWTIGWVSQFSIFSNLIVKNG